MTFELFCSCDRSGNGAERKSEQQEDKGTDWQNQITYQEVLSIQHTTIANNGKMLPYVKAQSTWDTQKAHHEAVDNGGLLTAPFEGIHAEGNNIFANCQYSGEAGKGHKQEE